MWTYSQSTGELSRDGKRIGAGYSGSRAGKNNSSLEASRDVGPIPRGEYYIGDPQDTATHGPHVMPLMPALEAQTFGRSGFLIHGDSKEHPGKASEGCIILSHDLRVAISDSEDDQLTVVE